MRYIELFAGIGGFRYGLEKANNSSQSTETKPNKTEHTKKQKCRGVGTPDEEGRNSLLSRWKQPTGNRIFQCVYANEWDKYACQIYRKNFGDKRMLNKNPEVYQATTKIRDKKGQLGEQFNKCAKGQYDYSRLHEGDIKEISAESIPDHDLLTAGFPCPSYSIAGKRKGFKDPRGALFFEICRVAKVKKPRLLLLENVKGLLNHDGGATFRTILYSLSELGYDCEWEVLNSKNFGVPQNRERVFIVGHLRGTGGGKVFPIGEGSQGIIQKREKNKGQTYSWALRGRDYKDGTNFINSIRVSGDRGKQKTYLKENEVQGLSSNPMSDNIPRIIDKRNIRRLTPTECERLQGFPDGWTEGISDSQRYKCLGNAVTTNVVEEIGKKILRR